MTTNSDAPMTLSDRVRQVMGLAEKATAGEWKTALCNAGEACWCRLVVHGPALPNGDYNIEDCVMASGSVAAKDAALICAAVNLLRDHGPALVAALEDGERMREALVEARDMVESWAAYASPYFQDKHDLAGNLAQLDAALHKEPSE